MFKPKLPMSALFFPFLPLFLGLEGCSHFSPVGGNRENASFPLEEIRERDGIRIDLEYKGTNNITGRALYPRNFRAYARPEVHRDLLKASEFLSKRGYGITVLDAWRPPIPAAKLWNAAVALDLRDFYAPPDITHHTRGTALDVTLHPLGAPSDRIEMHSDYDHFPLAEDGAPPEPSAHSRLLVSAMKQAGFSAHAREWWHFEHPSGNYSDIVQDPKSRIKFKREGRGNTGVQD